MNQKNRILLSLLLVGAVLFSTGMIDFGPQSSGYVLSCVDSDGGLDVYTKGHTTVSAEFGSQNANTDNCDGTYIYEAYCAYNSQIVAAHTGTGTYSGEYRMKCPYASSGYGCVAGVCTKPAGATTTLPTVTTTTLNGEIPEPDPVDPTEPENLIWLAFGGVGLLILQPWSSRQPKNPLPMP